MMDVSKNAERFMGYADVYHMARPRGPRFVVDCLINYLGYFPQTVVDLGCGTGLSTRLWGTAAAEVIGVEPSPDMMLMRRSIVCRSKISALSMPLPMKRALRRNALIW